MGIFDNFVYKDGKIADNSWLKWFHWINNARKTLIVCVAALVLLLPHLERTGINFVSGWLVHPLGVITCTTPFGG